jgi:hypothetical protein
MEYRIAQNATYDRGPQRGLGIHNSIRTVKMATQFLAETLELLQHARRVKTRQVQVIHPCKAASSCEHELGPFHSSDFLGSIPRWVMWDFATSPTYLPPNKCNCRTPKPCTNTFLLCLYPCDKWRDDNTPRL